MLRPMARRAVRILPSLRQAAARARPAPTRLKLTASLIHSSLDASLKRLKTDHVDVFALHDPDDQDLADEGVARALADVLQNGKARAIGVAGTPESALAAIRYGLPVRHLQFSDAPQLGNLSHVKMAIGMASNSLSLATHSVFGHGAAPPQQEIPDRIRRQLASLLGENGDVQITTRTLNAAALRYALAVNPRGVVLLSMFSPEHLRFNLQHLTHSRNEEIEMISRLFQHITLHRDPK
jgi:aryl-alcohol dehydrogenase-like predicted oxidoreductase